MLSGLLTASILFYISLRGAVSFCTVLPQVEPQWGQTYSYLSPSGRISSRRLRTCTARLHLGQASRVASNRSNEALLCSGIDDQ